MIFHRYFLGLSNKPFANESEAPKAQDKETDPQFPVSAAGSNGRCNTIQCIDSKMLPRENHLFGCTWSKPKQGSVPTGLTLASDFSLCFQWQVGSSLVLRRPIEITAFIRHLDCSVF